MLELAKGLKATFRRLTRTALPFSEPDPAYGKPRPMTGLKMTPEKRAKAAAYRGSINMGKRELLLKR